MELGLKFSRVADEFNSDLPIVKDRAGPLFASRETEATFVLTAQLKGYSRGNIKVDINEDGSLMGISGERQIKETIIVGKTVYKTETVNKGFKKIFRIPEGVILDKIKATFNNDESTLTISVPKKVKGIRGPTIEEATEKHEIARERLGSLQITDEIEAKIGEEDKGEETAPVLRGDGIVDETKCDKENAIREEERSEGSKWCKMCVPIVAGSTLLVTVVVFVIQIMKSRRQNCRRN